MRYYSNYNHISAIYFIQKSPQETYWDLEEGAKGSLNGIAEPRGPKGSPALCRHETEGTHRPPKPSCLINLRNSGHKQKFVNNAIGDFHLDQQAP